MDNIYNIIRKLAKTRKAQNYYLSVKNIPSLVLFENNNELSLIQEFYLSYLYFYNELYSDIGLKKVNDLVLSDEIYEDAYYRYKNEHQVDNKSKKKDIKGKEIKLVFNKTKGK